MCKVWENSRFVCEPKQYSVKVWSKECVQKFEPKPDGSLEAPMVDGDADLQKLVIRHYLITFNEKLTGCQVHYEVRSH